MLNLQKVLQSQFGLPAGRITKTAGGWSAEAYKVTAGGQAYFLKVYDKTRPSIKPWLERIDVYGPSLLVLQENALLKKHLPKLYQTVAGSYKAETRDKVLLLFAYLEARTLVSGQLSKVQAEQTAEILGALHASTVHLPLPTQALAENTRLSHCQKLKSLLVQKGTLPEALQSLLEKNGTNLNNAFELVGCLHKKRLAVMDGLVLCHTDAHTGNIMQGELLYLVDWEGLCLAPAEADLFILHQQKHWQSFLQVYEQNRPGFAIDRQLLDYYILKRILQDIWEFCEQLLFDELPPANQENIYSHLNSELCHLANCLNKNIP